MGSLLRRTPCPSTIKTADQSDKPKTDPGDRPGQRGPARRTNSNAALSCLSAAIQASAGYSSSSVNDEEEESGSQEQARRGAAAVILALGGGGIAYATDGGSVVGPDAGKAKGVALAAVGGETVTELERDGGNGAFEVEVERGDGSQVEVHLDGDLNVFGREASEDWPGDQDEPNDDRSDGGT